MEKLRLSTVKERAFAAAVMAALAAFFAILLYVLRSAGTAFIAVACTSVFLLILFGTYVFSVFSSWCLVDVRNRELTIKGLRSVKLDVTSAVSVKSQEFNSGNTISRRIMLLDADGNLAAAFVTHFTMDKGIQAESAARQLAQILDLEFIPSLEPWEYDPEARKAHAEAQAEEKKAAAQERISLLKEKFSSGKARAGTEPTPAPKEENGELEDSINYDALDDEK